MTMPRDSSEGLTIRDLVMEVRTSVARIHEDLTSFKATVVTKAEFDVFKEAQRQTRRWSLGIILSVLGVGTAIVSVFLANLN